MVIKNKLAWSSIDDVNRDFITCKLFYSCGDAEKVKK